VSSRSSSWVGKRIDLEGVRHIRCPNKVDELDGTSYVQVRFNPLSFDDGLEWHQDEGIVAFELDLEAEAGVIGALNFRAEFCTCGGHAVSGRAPAWIFPSNPMDQVAWMRIPVLVRRRMNCVLGMLAGGKKNRPNFRDWHESTETGWSLP